MTWACLDTTRDRGAATRASHSIQRGHRAVKLQTRPDNPPDAVIPPNIVQRPAVSESPVEELVAYPLRPADPPLALRTRTRMREDDPVTPS
jgi:hypothetical protein